MTFLLKKRLFNIVYLLLFVLSLQGVYAANNGWKYSANSVLSQGNWYKIKIENGTGVYKLTYDDLKKIGLSNPADVKIYGYGGWILDEDFKKSYVDDLPEVSIWMSKDRENFGQGDYILFYARGDIKWEYNDKTGEFEHTQNPYSFDSYYFVTESSEYPNLMEVQSSQKEGTTVVNSYNDYALHESEEVNIGKTGREFYGENFLSNSKRQFTFSTPGATSDPALIRYNFASKATLSACILKVSLNNALLASTPSTTTTDNDIYATAINSAVETTALKDANTIDLEMVKYDNGVSNAYLNYIRINYKRRLSPYGAVTLFRNTTVSDNLTFRISSATSSMLVFDVTDNTQVSRLETQLSGSTMSFSASNSSLREYALVDLSKNIPTPTILSNGKIDNQNLHSLPNVDMIVIAPAVFQQYAQELADLHQAESGLTSHVVTPELIYNEFSSGKPDATAYRRFMKMFYDRASDESDKPKYLLLFGNGTFNNRFIGDWTDSEKQVMLLTYQSKESLSELASYVTDDYMGFLEDSSTDDLNAEVLHLGIGRIPARTAQEAQDVVNKIKGYMMNRNKGLWQNNITFVADDFVAGKNAYSTEKQHVDDAEDFSNYIEKNHPDFIVNKIYEDAYERVIEANGARYPTATQALLDRINNGTLVLSYIGHGSTYSWTHENLLLYAHINALTNDKLPLWITTTCDFSRFDGNNISAGEWALLKKTGGAIALFSTVRAVYIAANTEMNKYMTEYLLTRENSKPKRLGDILRGAKSEARLTNESKLRFMLLGDPALRLAYPDNTYKVEVSEINGLDVSSNNTINIQALDNTVIVGHIVDESGNIISDYNGTLEAVIFDSQQMLSTRGNVVGSDRAKEYKAYPNTLYAGRVEIKNGEYRVEFTVPKDILYVNDKGKMNFYAYDETGTREAQGSFYNYTVGGTNPSVPEEENPPVVERLLLNKTEVDLNSDDPVYVSPSIRFYAEVSDDTGINLSSAIGHNIALIIDNGVSKTEYNLTQNFVSEDGSTKRGSVTYDISGLAPGNYTLEFKIWDVFNNSKSEIAYFIVSNDIEPSNYNFEIWGNPANSVTKFVFKTNGAVGNNVNLKMAVYSLSGKLVWIREEKGAISTLNGYEYDWNLMSNGSGRIIPGIYICTGQVTVDGKTFSVQAQKLLVTD